MLLCGIAITAADGNPTTCILIRFLAPKCALPHWPLLKPQLPFVSWDPLDIMNEFLLTLKNVCHSPKYVQTHCMNAKP